MAYKIYNMFADMDANDYAETKESDIDFIQALIDEIGVKATVDYLKQYFEI